MVSDEPLRFAFVENGLNKRTFNEISEKTGIPMGTLMARKAKAVQIVREKLEQKGLISHTENSENRKSQTIKADN